jgi:hypothetical protein
MLIIVRFIEVNTHMINKFKFNCINFKLIQLKEMLTVEKVKKFLDETISSGWVPSGDRRHPGLVCKVPDRINEIMQLYITSELWKYISVDLSGCSPLFLRNKLEMCVYSNNYKYFASDPNKKIYQEKITFMQTKIIENIFMYNETTYIPYFHPQGYGLSIISKISKEDLINKISQLIPSEISSTLYFEDSYFRIPYERVFLIEDYFTRPLPLYFPVDGDISCKLCKYLNEATSHMGSDWWNPSPDKDEKDEEIKINFKGEIPRNYTQIVNELLMNDDSVVIDDNSLIIKNVKFLYSMLWNREIQIPLESFEHNNLTIDEVYKRIDDYKQQLQE